uniref:Uncharacterized protein n=1 Tax=viral metagenome TaxID=1070528 RepID=A0A6C0FAI1_9ZZZZ|tara:strand:- start:20027 stop:21355 length:1329 start_codon:yes stop_codon:yes gene_type:complete
MPSNNSSSKKTLQINPEYFKQGKRKGGTAGKNTQKISRKRNTPVKHNTIKRELIKRIQQHKQNEQIEQTQRKNKQENTLGSMTSEMETNEFKGAVNYLNVLAKSKKKNERAAARQQRAGNVNRKARTLKNVNSQPTNPLPPNVNLELPQELAVNNQSLIQPSYQNTTPLVLNTSIPPANINYRIPSPPVITQVPPSLLPQPQIQTHPTNPQQMYYVTPIPVAPEPPYSNLKTSSTKPTYKQWTRKNTLRVPDKISNNNIQSKQSEHTNNNMVSKEKLGNISERENKLRMLQSKFSSAANKVTEEPTKKKEAPVMELKRYYEIADEKNGNVNIVGGKPRKKIIKRTIKKKYTVGKSRVKRQVSVLVKNLHTRKKIVDAKKELKQTPISEIKKYLKAHGFIKSGSVAPNNVLREIFESSMMSGDVTNLNTAIQLHNYMDEENET